MVYRDAAASSRHSGTLAQAAARRRSPVRALASQSEREKLGRENHKASAREHLRRALTWDRRAEIAQHAQLRIDTGLQVYFCDPRSPWLRASDENTNGLLRQYSPRGTDLARYSAPELAAVAATLNSRPRKTIGWRTPAEVLDEHLTATA